MSDTSPIDYQKLRVNGIYQQNAEGDLMMRVKVPAGVLSAEQAFKVCEIAERFAKGMLHLSTRGSIELHWLRYENVAEVARLLAAVGLTTRGACGGAVRGISCSTTFAEGFDVTQVLVRKLHRHFAGNPHFEGLPKKFKIGVDAGYGNSRHLIQDVGLVFLGREEERDLYDVWVAGGLGRQPQQGFLLAGRVAEKRLIPIIEGALRIFKKHGKPGKRLKHLVNDIGEQAFRELLAAETATVPALEIESALDRSLTAAPGAGGWVNVPVFAGELRTVDFRQLARIASNHAEGFMALTAEQNVALLLSDPADRQRVERALADAGLAANRPEQQMVFRICPGGHECRMGLAPVRDVGRRLTEVMGPQAMHYSWAISGCGNSCTQPQLADFGITSAKKVTGEDGRRRPLFTLYRREGEGLGTPQRENLTLDELLTVVRNLG